jgi:hypothetical protein
MKRNRFWSQRKNRPKGGAGLVQKRAGFAVGDQPGLEIAAGMRVDLFQDFPPGIACVQFQVSFGLRAQTRWATARQALLGAISRRPARDPPREHWPARSSHNNAKVRLFSAVSGDSPSGTPSTAQRAEPLRRTPRA